MGAGKDYLTIGQMAKLHNINKKTLLFYDQIGLFSPELTGENGYRYYSYSQCQLLERILFLRELDVPIEDIKHQLKTARAKDTLAFLLERREKNLAHIRRLKEYDKVLGRKEEELKQALARVPGRVELLELPEQKYLVTGDLPEGEDFRQFISSLLIEYGLEHLYYYSFGSVVAREDLLAGRMVSRRFFAAYLPEMRGLPHVLRPAGKYLACCWQGGWEGISTAYERIKSAAQSQSLRLSGDAFERLLIDEFSTSDPEEFLVEISVPVTADRASQSD